MNQESDGELSPVSALGQEFDAALSAEEGEAGRRRMPGRRAPRSQPASRPRSSARTRRHSSTATAVYGGSPIQAPNPPADLDGAPATEPPLTRSSEYVRWVQSTLNQVARAALPLDGVMQWATRAAVRRFQTGAGLPADGIVGPDTERALLAARATNVAKGIPGAAQAQIGANELGEVAARRPLRPTRTAIPARQADSLRGPALVAHWHVNRTCPDGRAWSSAPQVQRMTPANMNPGFLTGADNVAPDARLQKALEQLLTGHREYRNLLAPTRAATPAPNAQDRLRIALVDLTGAKLCAPGLAGWGLTLPMAGASTAKVGIVYAAQQLLCDVRELIRAGNICTVAELKHTTAKAWASLTCKPDLDWLFQFDTKVSPLGISHSARLDDHLQRMVDATDPQNNAISTPSASELIIRIGFEYIASALWQSGLYHPLRRGVWFGNTFQSRPPTARLDQRCHVPGTYIAWRKNPLGSTGITLTPLAIATYFTLLAQRRLVSIAASQRIEGLLSKGCTWLTHQLPAATIRAQKCGLTSEYLHEAALIEHGDLRYVLVYLTRNVGRRPELYRQLTRDLDTLVRSNNARTP